MPDSRNPINDGSTGIDNRGYVVSIIYGTGHGLPPDSSSGGASAKDAISPEILFYRTEASESSPVATGTCPSYISPVLQRFLSLVEFLS